MSIIDFFDIYDWKHLLAWQTLRDTGNWPKDFIPEGVECPLEGAWKIIITARMADAWLTMQMGADKDWRD